MLLLWRFWRTSIRLDLTSYRAMIAKGHAPISSGRARSYQSALAWMRPAFTMCDRPTQAVGQVVVLVCRSLESCSGILRHQPLHDMRISTMTHCVVLPRASEVGLLPHWPGRPVDQ